VTAGCDTVAGPGWDDGSGSGWIAVESPDTHSHCHLDRSGKDGNRPGAPGARLPTPSPTAPVGAARRAPPCIPPVGRRPPGKGSRDRRWAGADPSPTRCSRRGSNRR